MFVCFLGHFLRILPCYITILHHHLGKICVFVHPQITNLSQSGTPGKWVTGVVSPLEVELFHPIYNCFCWANCVGISKFRDKKWHLVEMNLCRKALRSLLISDCPSFCEQDFLSSRPTPSHNTTPNKEIPTKNPSL